MPYTYKHGDRPLDGLTIQRAVGRGGFGEVYYTLADSGKQLALKYLRENPEVELRGIAHVLNLKSPHLISIYDVRRNEAADVFVLMEYISGPSLRDLMNAEPNGFAPQKAAFFFTGIAKGLAYLHERGIVHRDLKPANIFYDDGYVKIGDYGLSKHISVSQHSGQTVSVGTVHYMAPEIGSGSYTKAIDIYALGVILYEMLTGRLPFIGASMAEILMRHLNERPDVSGVPAPFGPIIARALAKDPRERYQDANEMLAALAESQELMAGAANFDASQLTHVPRHETGGEVDRTMTTPPPPRPPIPPLDARAPLPVGDAPMEVPALNARWQKRVRDLSQRLERKEKQLARKMGMARPPTLRPFDNVPGPTTKKKGRVSGAAHSRGEKQSVFAGLLVLAAVTLVGSVVLGYVATPDSLRGDGDEQFTRTVVIGLALLGATVGTLVAYYLAIRRSPIENGLLHRLVYCGIALPFLGPAWALSRETRDVKTSTISAATFDEMRAKRQIRGGPQSHGEHEDDEEAAGAARAHAQALVEAERAGQEHRNAEHSARAATRNTRSRTTYRTTEFRHDGMAVTEVRARDGEVKYQLRKRVVDQGFSRIPLTPLLALLVCDFTRRLRSGRIGRVQGADAFWPAIVGLIGGGIIGANGYVLLGAAMCGGVSLLAQGAMATWPGGAPVSSAPEAAVTPPVDRAAPVPPPGAAAPMLDETQLAQRVPPAPPIAPVPPPPMATAAPTMPEQLHPEAVVVEARSGRLNRVVAGLGWLLLLGSLVAAVLAARALQSEAPDSPFGAALHNIQHQMADPNAVTKILRAAVTLGALLVGIARVISGRALWWRALLGFFMLQGLVSLLLGPFFPEFQAAISSPLALAENPISVMSYWKVIGLLIGIAGSVRLMAYRGRAARCAARPAGSKC